MTNDTITIIISILVPMGGGFAWIMHRINQLENKLGTIETRLTIIETIMAMAGVPLKKLKAIEE